MKMLSVVALLLVSAGAFASEFELTIVNNSEALVSLSRLRGVSIPKMCEDSISVCWTDRFKIHRSFSESSSDIQGSKTFKLEHRHFETPIILTIDDGEVEKKIRLRPCLFVTPDFPHAGPKFKVSTTSDSYESYCFTSGSTVINIVNSEE